MPTPPESPPVHDHLQVFGCNAGCPAYRLPSPLRDAIRSTDKVPAYTERADDTARGEWLSLASSWHDHETPEAWDAGHVLPWMRRIVELAGQPASELADFHHGTAHRHDCDATVDSGVPCSRDCCSELYAIAQDTERQLGLLTEPAPMTAGAAAHHGFRPAWVSALEAYASGDELLLDFNGADVPFRVRELSPALPARHLARLARRLALHVTNLDGPGHHARRRRLLPVRPVDAGDDVVVGEHPLHRPPDPGHVLPDQHTGRAGGGLGQVDGELAAVVAHQRLGGLGGLGAGRLRGRPAMLEQPAHPAPHPRVGVEPALEGSLPSLHGRPDGVGGHPARRIAACSSSSLPAGTPDTWGVGPYRMTGDPKHLHRLEQRADGSWAGCYSALDGRMGL